MLHAKPNLEAVLTHYGVQLRRYGAGWQKICCPVHDESRPSCTANLDIGRIQCHACGFSGDAWDLIGEKEGLDFEASIAYGEQFPTDSNSPVRSSGERARSTNLLGESRDQRTHRTPPATRVRRTWG